MIDHTNAELEQAVKDALTPVRARRFLAPGGRAGNGHGYIAQPKRELPEVADPPQVVERIASATSVYDEPEAPSPAWVDAEAELAAEYSRLRHVAEVQQRREIRLGLTVEARLADAQRLAKARHVDISGDLFVIRRALERAHAARRRPTPETRQELRATQLASGEAPAPLLQRLELLEALLDGPIEMAA